MKSKMMADFINVEILFIKKRKLTDHLLLKGFETDLVAEIVKGL